MSNAARIKKIQDRLMIGKHEPIEYIVSLNVYKDKSFVESQALPGGYNEACCNGGMSAIQGKKFLGTFTYAERPKVAEKLQKIYFRTQKEIKDDPTAGMALVWLTLYEKENGELVESP